MDLLPRVAVAASGGRDSTALLHCTARAAAQLGAQVVALHVHHGLNAAADDWLQQVRDQARRWNAEFACQRLLTPPAAGQSVEAWARRERYRALAELAHASGCGLVLLAHHRRDQAETFLLQALRGGGPAGLAAMPRLARRAGLTWARPWLDEPREAIEAYLRRHRLRHADDASNVDPRYARNRLRLQVWPALQQAFPDVETVLAAAAVQAYEAVSLADEVSAFDLPRLLAGQALDTAAWKGLPPARRRNALRAWLNDRLGRAPPQKLLARLFDELPRHSAATWEAPDAVLRLYRGRLELRPLAQDAPIERPTAGPVTRDLGTAGCHAIDGWRGHLLVEPVAEGGVVPALLRGVTVRARGGGESFSLGPRAVARRLKKQFQACGIAAWQREGPLLFGADGRLLFVPGLGIDGAAQAAKGEPQFSLLWLPDPAPAPAPAPATTGQRQSRG